MNNSLRLMNNWSINQMYCNICLMFFMFFFPCFYLCLCFFFCDPSCKLVGGNCVAVYLGRGMAGWASPVQCPAARCSTLTWFPSAHQPFVLIQPSTLYPLPTVLASTVLYYTRLDLPVRCTPYSLPYFTHAKYLPSILFI